MPDIAATPLWRTLGFDDLLMRTWDDETFVFNPASGHTHLLNGVAVELLRLLHEQPRSSEQLAAELGDPALQQLPELQQQLHQLALIGLLCRQAAVD